MLPISTPLSRMAWPIRLIPFCTDAELENHFHLYRSDCGVLGSACVSHVGFGVSPKQAFLGAMLRFGIGNHRKSSRRRDTVASTRDECATRTSDPPLARWTLLAGACAMKF